MCAHLSREYLLHPEEPRGHQELDLCTRLIVCVPCFHALSPGDAPSLGAGRHRVGRSRCSPHGVRRSFPAVETDLPVCSRPDMHYGPESSPAAGCTECRLGRRVSQEVLRGRAGLPACLSPPPLLPSPLPKAKVKLWGPLLCVLPPAA